MDKFLEMYTLPRMNKEEIENMDIRIISNEIVPLLKQQKCFCFLLVPANIWSLTATAATAH